MSYSNRFLQDFSPLFSAILKTKGLTLQTVEIEIIDEEAESFHYFEPVDVKEVLEQVSDELNFLTIYTDRPAYFFEFAEKMYEENGLIVRLFWKNELKSSSVSCNRTVILDFEWEGRCHNGLIGPGRYYIPIHKKRWLYAFEKEEEGERQFVPQTAENLDIIVPIGYNTMTVKGMKNRQRRRNADRFEAAFYGEET